MLHLYTLAVLALANIVPVHTQSPWTCFVGQKTRLDKWSTRDMSIRAAQTFCDDGAKNNFNDTLRYFNKGTPDYIALSMEFEPNQKPSKEWCMEGFKSIIDNCDKNVKQNPLEWIHGGKWENLTQGSPQNNFTAYFIISPLGQRYTPGCCYIKMQEYETKIKRDVFEHDIEGDIYDGAGARMIHINRIRSDDKRTASIGGLHAVLLITAQKRGDYVHFSIGDQSWKSSEVNKFSKACADSQHSCKVGEYKGIGDKIYKRPIECWFDC